MIIRIQNPWTTNLEALPTPSFPIAAGGKSITKSGAILFRLKILDVVKFWYELCVARFCHRSRFAWNTFNDPPPLPATARLSLFSDRLKLLEWYFLIGFPSPFSPFDESDSRWHLSSLPGGRVSLRRFRTSELLVCSGGSPMPPSSGLDRNSTQSSGSSSLLAVPPLLPLLPPPSGAGDLSRLTVIFVGSA